MGPARDVETKGGAVKTSIMRVGGGPCSLEEFADRAGLEMEVHERSRTYGGARFFAYFKGAEVMDRGCLTGAFGNGATPDAAIAAYAKEIEGRRLAIGAYTPERREVDVPNELTTNPMHGAGPEGK